MPVLHMIELVDASIRGTQLAGLPQKRTAI